MLLFFFFICFCFFFLCFSFFLFFFQAEDGIRDLVRSRGLGDVYKRQGHVHRQTDGQIDGREGLPLAQAGAGDADDIPALLSHSMRDLSPKNLEGIDEPAALKACDDAPLP